MSDDGPIGFRRTDDAPDVLDGDWILEGDGTLHTSRGTFTPDGNLITSDGVEQDRWPTFGQWSPVHRRQE